ncbi:MAG: hypothetical protein J6R16_04670 [Alistipes sp.]|nr:hypothetical protein [Alistipes sp.]
MKTNKSNTNQLPTTEDFAKIQSFTNAVIDCNSKFSALQNFFELVKRVGDTSLIYHLSDTLHHTINDVTEHFISLLPHEDKD